MATQFPGNIDNFQNPTPTDFLDNPSHSGQHTNENDAIKAIEEKVGKDGSTDRESLDFMIKTGWVPLANTAVFINEKVFRLTGDYRSTLKVGAKIKLTNGSVKTFYIIHNTYTNGNSYIRLAGEVMLNSTNNITDVFYSYQDSPKGFKRGQDWYFFDGHLSRDWVANAIEEKIPFIRRLDPNEDYNEGSRRWVCPVEGYYMVDLGIRFNEGIVANKIVKCSIRVNNQNKAESTVHTSVSGYQINANVSKLLKLERNDYVEGWAYQNMSNSSYAQGGSFSIIFVGVNE